MKLNDKFNIKKEEVAVKKDLFTSAKVTLKKIEQHKENKMRFTFKEDKNKTPFLFICKAEEELLKPLFKALLAKRLTEEFEAEKASIEKQKEEISKPFLAEIASLKIKDEKERQSVVENIKKAMEEEITKLPEPVPVDSNFATIYSSIEEKDLVDCKLKVIALDCIKGGKEVKLIQSFSEVN